MSTEAKKWFGLMALLAGIALVLWVFLNQGPELLAKLLSAGAFIPFAMTTGKHDFPPLTRGQIAMGIGAFIIAVALFLATQ